MGKTEDRFTSEELQECLNSVQGSIFQYQGVIDHTEEGMQAHTIATAQNKKLVSLRDKLVTLIMNGKAVKGD